jgi:polyisoprenoid-binding protein YceI
VNLAMTGARGGAFVLALLGAAAAAAAPLHPVIVAQSSLSFVATQQGERFTGVFRAFDARIEYAAEDLPGSRFDVSIPLRSVDTKSDERDQSLATADWFDAARYPTATFRTLAMRTTPTGVVADAELSIKGRTRRITFPFTWKSTPAGATLDARVTLDRLDFNLGAGEWADDGTIGRKVEVLVHLALGPAAPPPPVKPVAGARAKR